MSKKTKLGQQEGRENRQKRASKGGFVREPECQIHFMLATRHCPFFMSRDKLEEIKLLQKLRKKAGGTTADALADGAKDDLLAPRADSEERPLPTELMDTFSKAKVVVTDTEEDPHMSVCASERLVLPPGLPEQTWLTICWLSLAACRKKFIEQELAKRLGKSIDSHENEDPETRRKRLEAEMYQIPDEYKVRAQCLGAAGQHSQGTSAYIQTLHIGHNG
jgi:hypothetical protein